jgi:hypothetical protein
LSSHAIFSSDGMIADAPSPTARRIREMRATNSGAKISFAGIRPPIP